MTKVNNLSFEIDLVLEQDIHEDLNQAAEPQSREEEEQFVADETSVGVPDEAMIFDEDDSRHALSEESGEDSDKEDVEEQKLDFDPAASLPVWRQMVEHWEQPLWLKKYTLQAGLSNSFSAEELSPKDYFLLMFNDELQTLIVRETNLYADQFFAKHPEKSQVEHFKNWKTFDKARLRAYIALLFHMGLANFPRIADHWRCDHLYSCPLCPNIMSRAEFFLINQFLHLTDNSRANTSDKLYKIRPLINYLVAKWKNFYTMHKEICIDERMIPYTGRVSFKQFVKNKPTRWGIKAFLLCDAVTGYVYDMKIYTGREGQTRAKNLAQNIVLELTRDVTDRGHHLYFDSYFCSVSTAEALSIRDIGCTGVIRKNARGIPDSVKKPKKLKKGESLFRAKGNLVVLVYRAKREVRLLTNITGNQTDAQGKPLIIESYNKWSRGVDKSNQRVSYYNFQRKSKKWWRTVAISLIETTLVNCYQLYKMKYPFTALPQLQFREKLIKQLLEDFLQEKKTSNKPRINPNLHKIDIREQRNCFMCSTTENRKTSVYYCIECDVNICPSVCYHKLHTSLELPKKQSGKKLR